jgi:hypothetical protein
MAIPAVVSLVCLLASGCGVTTGKAVKETPDRALIPRPIVERELPNLLLDAGELNAATGSTGLTITSAQNVMSDESDTMSPAECLAIDGAAEAPVYATSGFQAEREQSLNDGNDFTHYVKQAVVLFPYVEKARAFFDASAQQWQACHQYMHVQSGTQWSVGPISVDRDILSTVATEQDSGTQWKCGRALALKNNVIADINTCSSDSPDAAVKIAERIADKVGAMW